MEKQLYENKKQKQTTTTKTLQTRLIFKHDKQYTNKSNITLPLLIVINIQEQQNQ